MAEVRPIDANALVAAIIGINGCDYGSMFDFTAHTAANEALNDVVRLIDDAPLLDYAPVRHGEWVAMVFTDTGKSAGYKCSECGLGARKKFTYCHCGAKMDGGKKE